MEGQESKLVTLHITTCSLYYWKYDDDNIENFLRMVTKKNQDYSKEEEKKLKELIAELYQVALKDDPQFHFFYEPEIIIRISKADVLEKVKLYLEAKGFGFVVYDYPLPQRVVRIVQYRRISYIFQLI